MVLKLSKTERMRTGARIARRVASDPTSLSLVVSALHVLG
jgi:hypothetical protein